MLNVWGTFSPFFEQLFDFDYAKKKKKLLHFQDSSLNGEQCVKVHSHIPAFSV